MEREKREIGERRERVPTVIAGLTCERTRDCFFYTALPYNLMVEFIKATALTLYVYKYLTEDEYTG